MQLNPDEQKDQNILNIPNEGSEFEPASMPTQTSVPQNARGIYAPHKPSRLQAVLFLIFALLVAGGLAVWQLFLNRGTLVISSDVGFEATINGRDLACEKASCSIVLEPKKYTIVMRRDGFKDDVEEVAVKRFETVTVTPKFVFIPVLQTFDTKGFSPLLPLTALKTAPAKSFKLPFKTENIFFNAAGNLAVVITDKGPYLFGAQSNSLTKLSFGTGIPFAWSGSFLAFLATNKAGGQTLFSFGAEADTPLVVFERPLTQPVLFGSSEGKFILLQDNDPTGVVYYLVDIQARTRRRLTVTANQKFVGFLGDYGIFSETEKITAESEEKTIYKLISLTETATTITLPNASFSASAMYKNTVYYVTPQEGSEGISGGATLSIDEALSQLGSGINQATQEVSTQKIPDVRYSLSRFDLATQKTTPIAPLVLKSGEIVSEIVVIDDVVLVRAGGSVYALKE